MSNGNAQLQLRLRLPNQEPIHVDCNRSTLEHCSKHFEDPHEPWEEFFGNDLLSDWKNRGTPQSINTAVAQEIIAKIQESLNEECFYLSYEQRDRQRQFLHKGWIVITQPGFVVIIWEELGEFSLKTIFYLKLATQEKNPANRFRRALQDLIERYCQMTDLGKMIDPTFEPKSYEKGEPAGIRTEFRFFPSPAAWGFREIETLNGLEWIWKPGKAPKRPAIKLNPNRP